MTEKALDAKHALDQLIEAYLKIAVQRIYMREVEDANYFLDELAKEASSLRLMLEWERTENRQLEAVVAEANRERDDAYGGMFAAKKRIEELEEKLAMATGRLT